jgi:hypothetical protein
MFKVTKKVLVTGLTLIIPLFAWAGGDHEMKSYKGSAEFEKLKSLVGTWKGEEGTGNDKKEVVVTYAVTAGGSAVVETLFPKTPMEMVSVYTDEGGKLAMTHYCVLANQPHMKLTGSTANSIVLAMSGKHGIADANEPHMHALTINFVDANTIEHRWTHFKDGKAGDAVVFELTRSQ